MMLVISNTEISQACECLEMAENLPVAKLKIKDMSWLTHIMHQRVKVIVMQDRNLRTMQTTK